MNCSACSAERLAAYHDGELPKGDAMLIAGHLASCAACSALDAQVRKVDAALARVRLIDVRQDFAATLMTMIVALPVPVARRFSAWWIGAYVAATWIVLAALNGLHVIAWQHFVADAGVLVAKTGIAFETLYRIADHLHLGILVGAAIGIEVLLMAVGATAGRKLLPRVRARLLGAQQ